MNEKKLFHLNNPIILGIIFFIIFTISISDKLTYDSINYAYQISEKPLKEQLHPHHLFYTPFMNLLISPFKKFLSLDNQLLFLQMLNVLISAITISFLYLTLKLLNTKTKILLLLILISGFSYAFSTYSQQIEVYQITILFIVLTQYFFIKALLTDKKERYLWLFLSGISFTLSMSFHQTAIFTGFGLVFLLFKHYKKLNYKFILDLSIVIILPLILITIFYIFAVSIVFKDINFSSFTKFLFSYALSGKWGKVNLNNLYEFPVGLISIFIYSTQLYIFFVKYINLLTLIILILIAAGIFFYLIKELKKENPAIEQNNFKYLFIPIIISNSAFIFYWEPLNTEFWMILLPSIICLLSIYFNKLNETGLYRLLKYVLIIEVLLFIFNTVYNKLEINHFKEYSKEIAEITNEKDFIVSEGNELVPYLIYYTNANIIDLVFVENKLIKKGDVYQKSRDSILSLIEYTKKQNGRLFFEKQIIDNEDIDKEDLFNYQYLVYLSRPQFLNWLKTLKFKKLQLRKYYIYLFEFN